MAQVNISHFTDINTEQSKQFSRQVQQAAALLVHDVEKAAIKPDTVTVIVNNMDRATSLSGADTEVQVFVSGNNWPKDSAGKPMDYASAKKHFDDMAAKFHANLTKHSIRKIYVWVTPFVASGWGE